MSRATVILNTDADRERAAKWCRKIKAGTIVEFKEVKRSLPQNAMLHAAITDVSTQIAWHGQRLSVDDWKRLFLDALNRELRAVPSIDGKSFVNLTRTSDLTKEECTDLITIVHAFGALHGVRFGDERKAA